MGAFLTVLFNVPAMAAGAPGWRVAAFPGAQVSLVKSNPARPRQMAAVKDGSLQLSRDGGLLWEASPLPLIARTLAFDPVDLDGLYAGTDRGLYVSNDFGRSWHLLESNLTGFKNNLGLAVGSDYIYASMYDGAGTFARVYRFSRSGAVADTGFPGANVSALTYDLDKHRLYAGYAGGILVSDDEGTSWQGLGRGQGSYTLNVAVKGSDIWQESADGLFKSSDGGANWELLAASGNLNNTNYGNSMRLAGLAVNNGRVYYGDASIYYPYHFLVEYNAPRASSILDARVFDVAAGGTRLWAATANGLLVNDDLVSSEARVRRPVIIIPGILGSWPVPLGVINNYESYIPERADAEYHTDLLLDPIQKTYDRLISNLVADGYQKGRTLFVFPYQWRQDNKLSARQLARKIRDVKRACGCQQVDLVGHSMGGLVARAYIESDYYAGDVKNLVEIATPNAGSVDAYAAWEAGVITSDNNGFQAYLKRIVFQNEAFHTGHITITQYVRQNVLSIGQLLPIFNYIQVRNYPNGYPRNQFLEELNRPELVALLRRRVALHIAGSKDYSTLSGLTVGNPSPGSDDWPHGKITGSQYAPGDGTVTRNSLEAIAGASRYLRGDHGGMVGRSDEYLASTLMSGYLPPTYQQISLFKTYLLVYVKSPVAISITDPDGLTVNDSSLAIPGSYYTGSNQATQFAVIPNYKPGSYQIDLTGTGNGPYSLVVEQVNADGSVIAGSETKGTTSAGQVWRYRYSSTQGGITILDPPGNSTTYRGPESGRAVPAFAPIPSVTGVKNDLVNLALSNQQSVGVDSGPLIKESAPIASRAKSLNHQIKITVGLFVALVAILLLWLKLQKSRRFGR